MTIEEKISKGRQYRSMVLEVREQNEPESYVVEGYATTYMQPYVLYSDETMEIREQVSKDAFSGCDMSDVIFQYDHQGRVFARTSNNTLSLLSDDHGLLINADLGGTTEGRHLYEEIAGGYTTKMSFGFIVSADTVEESKDEDGRRVYLRTITQIGKLFDVSAVSLPANDATEISARSFVDGVIAQAEAERLLKAEEERKRKQLKLMLDLMEV